MSKGSQAQNAFSAEQTLRCAANLASMVQESGTTRLSEGFKRPLGAHLRAGPDFPVEKESGRLGHALKELGIDHTALSHRATSESGGTCSDLPRALIPTLIALCSSRTTPRGWTNLCAERVLRTAGGGSHRRAFQRLVIRSVGRPPQRIGIMSECLAP